MIATIASISGDQDHRLQEWPSMAALQAKRKPSSRCATRVAEKRAGSFDPL